METQMRETLEVMKVEMCIMRKLDFQIGKNKRYNNSQLPL